MRKNGIENIDELIENLAIELSGYFIGTNYVVEFIAVPIPLKNKEANVEQIFKQYAVHEQFKQNLVNEITIENAKNKLNNLITDSSLNENRDGKNSDIKKALKRIDKLWSLVSHYVSFKDSIIYSYEGLSNIGIFWSFALLIVDKKSGIAYFVGCGASD